MNRRTFIKGMLGASSFLFSSNLLSITNPKNSNLTIMHTNDTHSRLDPFPNGNGARSNMGGVAKRATLIKRIKNMNPNNLVIDAGDVFQGTPYFNFYKGKLEYETIELMKYDYITIGNHEFDLGSKKLIQAMQYLKNTKIISSNYKSELLGFKNKVQENEIIIKDGIKIGIFALGIEFKGLVSSSSHKGIYYSDYLSEAKKQIKKLKSQKTDFIICISHIGVEDDEYLANTVSGIDLIIGGHSHTKLDKPLKKNNTIILQAASSGIFLGKLDLHFYNKKLKNYKYTLLPVK